MDGKPGPCWDHPGLRDAATRFIAELTRTLGKYKNIWAWNTFQEIGFWPNTAGKLGFCYCPHTLARFREWLREQYASLDALNATWQINYADWDEVEPPRREEPLAPFIDWRYFMDDVYMARQIAFKTRTLRENDPYKRPVFSHADTPRIGSGAEWRWARTGDFFGTSNYPKWNNGHPWDDPVTSEDAALRNEIWEEMMLCTDLARSNNGRDRALLGRRISRRTHLDLAALWAETDPEGLARLDAGGAGLRHDRHQLLESSGRALLERSKWLRLARSYRRHIRAHGGCKSHRRGNTAT